MGHNESWFESQPVSEDFKCPICQDVLQDPQIANHCEHVFCSVCIQKFFQVSNNNNNRRINCPVCREPFNLSDLKPTMRAFRNLLDKLRIRCQFELCLEVVELQHFEQHCLNCDQNPDNQRKPVLCPKLCGADIVPGNCDNHDCVVFLQEQILLLTIDNSKKESEIEKLTSEVNKLRQGNQQYQTRRTNVDMVPNSGFSNGRQFSNQFKPQPPFSRIINSSSSTTSQTSNSDSYINRCIKEIEKIQLATFK